MDNQKINDFNARKKAVEKDYIIAFGIFGIALVVFLVLYSQNIYENLIVIPIIIAIGGLVFLIKGSTGYAKLKKEFKTTFLKNMFQELIPGIQYKPYEGLSKQVVYDGEFLKKADRYHSEDFLEGKIDDVDFISSDVRLEERHVRRTKNGTQVYYVPYFIGRVFRFDFHKELVGRLQVLEKGSPYSRFRFNRVKLESIDFNQKFRTFAEDEHTAFYIITPDIMEAMFEVEKRNPGVIRFSFKDQQLYIALNNNKNTFELKLFKAISTEEIEMFKKDLLTIKDFITTLKLNNNIFKKIGG
jgi:hypothetical protein